MIAMIKYYYLRFVKIVTSWFIFKLTSDSFYKTEGVVLFILRIFSIL